MSVDGDSVPTTGRIKPVPEQLEAEERRRRLSATLKDLTEGAARKTAIPERVRKTLVSVVASRSLEEQKLERQIASQKPGQGESAKRIKAINDIRSLHDYDVELFVAWVQQLSKSGGLADKRTADAVCLHGKRLKESHRYQASKENIERLASFSGSRSAKLESVFELLPTGQNKEELRKLEEERGITYSLVLDHHSREFIEAYALLRANFPADELDPSADLMTMLDSNSRRYAMLSTNDFRTVAPDLSEPLYLRYYLIVAKDKDDKVVAVMDGNFIANEKANALYCAHIVVPEEERRGGMATLIYSSALGLGNTYARSAEQRLNSLGLDVKYRTPIAGNRLMHYILESEPPNLESEEAVRLTLGRLMFHGRGSGLSAIPSLLYAQVDLDYEKDGKFLQKDWNSVPLLLLVRRIGREADALVTADEMAAIAELLPSYFLSAGLYNADGVRYDIKHSLSRLAGSKGPDKIPIIQLPNAVDELQRVDELREFIASIGTMDGRCGQFYPDHLWTKEYLERFDSARKTGLSYTVERALDYMRNRIRKRMEIAPPSY